MLLFIKISAATHISLQAEKDALLEYVTVICHIRIWNGIGISK